jgi:hypothetical protein
VVAASALFGDDIIALFTNIGTYIETNDGL